MDVWADKIDTQVVLLIGAIALFFLLSRLFSGCSVVRQAPFYPL